MPQQPMVYRPFCFGFEKEKEIIFPGANVKRFSLSAEKEKPLF
jgi:hypothetical protein